MPTELVLLSEVAVSDAAIARAAAALHPTATFLDYHDGLVRQVVDGDGRALLSVYPSRPVLDRSQAVRCVADPPAGFALWTDVVIPYGEPTDGRALADAIATTVGGVVVDRI